MGRTLIHFLLAITTLSLPFGDAAGQGSNKSNPVAKSPGYECVTRFETEDWKLLLAGLKVTNPDTFQRLSTDPEFRSKQIENLRQLFAFGCQAVKDGALSDPVNAGELENIRNEIVALEFEKIANKTVKKAPIGSVSKERVDSFYKLPENVARFEAFLKVKLELLRREGSAVGNEVMPEEERSEARAVFAKTSLLEADSKLEAVKIEPAFFKRVGLTIKLQQTQFLAKIVSRSIALEMMVSDGEIQEYIGKHPELGPEKKKAKAETILARARAGEDFAKLADENSDDPGNLTDNGKKNGGLYTDVPEGKMMPAFETAALALQPGTVSPVLVETEYGYHVIKLEKKSGKAGSEGADKLTYNVRHILISTGVKDPANPDGREVPVREFVRNLLESGKEEIFVGKILKDNPVWMADIPVAPESPAIPGSRTRKPVH
jgi:hypothetical protein